ncbi:MAG: helix-turn-helix domain-containing protein [Bacteroidota bacterium]
MKNEIFIERGTNYQFSAATLSLYETNCPCKGIAFNFDKYVITIMLSGHKTIVNAQNKVEFFPGTIFIPERNTTQVVEISSASLTNPTRCLVLDVTPKFMEATYQEYARSAFAKDQSDQQNMTSIDRFFSNDTATIEAFTRFYKYAQTAASDLDELVNENILKELLFRLFRTDARQLLLANLNFMVSDSMIEQVIKYIRLNLTQPLTIKDLIEVARCSKTKLFNRFKEEMGLTPVQFIMNERIKYAEKLIPHTPMLQSVAFQSGFNTYEHFYSSFKKLRGESPREYRQRVA